MCPLQHPSLTALRWYRHEGRFYEGALFHLCIPRLFLLVFSTRLSFHGTFMLLMGDLDFPSKPNSEPIIWVYERTRNERTYVRLGSNRIYWKSPCHALVGRSKHCRRLHHVLLDPLAHTLLHQHVVLTLPAHLDAL